MSSILNALDNRHCSGYATAPPLVSSLPPCRRAASCPLPFVLTTPLSACLQLPGLHAPAGPSALQPFRPPTAAEAAAAALHGELPAVPGLGPASAAAQADVDAFLRGMPPQAGPDFAEFESIYAQQQPRLAQPPPGVAALPPLLEAQGRAAAAPVLQASTRWASRCKHQLLHVAADPRPCTPAFQRPPATMLCCIRPA